MPIEFLWGDEDFLIERALTKIKNDVLKGEINDFNYRVVDSPSFAEFSELIRLNPMMFGSTMVVVKCKNYFVSVKNKKDLDEKQVADLVSGLQNINENLYLVLLCPISRGENKKPDSRKKLYKEISKLTTPQEFTSFKSYEEYKIIPVLKTMAKELDIEIQDSECSMLIQTSGSYLRDLYNQLEKLKLFAYPDKKITKDMLNQIISSTTNVFSISDAIVQKNYTKALSMLSEILQKEHYLPSLALIQSSITNYLKLKIYSNSMSPRDLSFKLGQHEFKIKKDLEKISNISVNELLRLKLNLVDIDFLLKNGTLSDPLCAYELAFVQNKIGVSK